MMVHIKRTECACEELKIKNYLYYVNPKRGHAFDGDQGMFYTRDWRDKREGGNDAIISKISMFYLQKKPS